MARVKGGVNARKKHNRVLKLAKGYRGARSKQYRVAKQSVMRALASSYEGRKQRKRQFRQLWIARINAAARMNGLSYSQFMHAPFLFLEKRYRIMSAAWIYCGIPWGTYPFYYEKFWKNKVRCQNLQNLQLQ